MPGHQILLPSGGASVFGLWGRHVAADSTAEWLQISRLSPDQYRHTDSTKNLEVDRVHLVRELSWGEIAGRRLLQASSSRYPVVV